MDIFAMDPGISMLLMSLLSVSLFCVCCFQFLRVITTPIPLFNHTGYTRSALQIGRGYKMISWGVLTGFFLTGLIISFIEVFTRL